MKKLYLLTLFLTVANFTIAQQPFTPGNLVLYRHNVGNSGAAAPNTATQNGNQAMQIFLDEYNFSDPDNPILVQSVPLPTAANGANKPITTVGWSAAESYMTRSADGRYLVVPGYNAVPGTNVWNQPSATINRVVALVDYNRNINSTTALTNVFSGMNYRSATSYDGTDVWVSGAAASGAENWNGPYYATTGSSTATNLGTGIQGSRDLKIFENQLYALVSTRVYKVGEGLPKTTNQTYTAVTPATTGDLYGFYLTDLGDGNKVIYYMDSKAGEQSVRKYSLVDGNWIANGLVTGIPSPRGVEGRVENGVVKLYIVSATSNPANGDSRVYLVDDNSGHNETITGTPKLLLDISGENKQFRSIAWAPVQVSVLPIKLSFFDVKHENDRVQVKWATSSETNNSHFEVLRSDGSEFKVIGTIKGAGNSEEEKSYSFVDSKPLNGVSYYQLRQVDFDGNADVSKIVPINISLEQTEIKVQGSVSNQKIEVTVFATKSGNSTIHITDASGKKISSSKIAIQKGNNTFSIPLKLQKTLYVISLITADEKYVTKFIPR
ncbi:hypothetical protein D3C87_154900 [compost metagenome]